MPYIAGNLPFSWLVMGVSNDCPILYGHSQPQSDISGDIRLYDAHPIAVDLDVWLGVW